MANNLLTASSYVQSPYVILNIGGYTFGSYSKNKSYSNYDITFPNYIQSFNVKKINGQLNQYTIRLVYAITEHTDPNLMDKVFGSVADTRLMDIRWGDFNSNTQQFESFQDYRVLITKVTTQVDFKSSRINYTVNATSTCYYLMNQKFYFPAQKGNAYDIIKGFIQNKQYQLGNAFPILNNPKATEFYLPDSLHYQQIQIQEQNTTVLDRLGGVVKSVLGFQDAQVMKNVYKTIDPQRDWDQYVQFQTDFYNNARDFNLSQAVLGPVGGLISLGRQLFTQNQMKNFRQDYITSQGNLVAKKYKFNEDGKKKSIFDTFSSIYSFFVDDTSNDASLLIRKIDKQKAQSRYYLDIGYPTENNVVNFSVITDDSWAILYKYNLDSPNNYTYRYDNKGDVVKQYDSNQSINVRYGKSTNIDLNWWNLMTNFPIKATLTIKGLVKDIKLMDYIMINTYFYGNKHTSSGMYVITAQQDNLDASGYRTTLSLLRTDQVQTNSLPTSTNDGYVNDYKIQYYNKNDYLGQYQKSSNTPVSDKKVQYYAQGNQQYSGGGRSF